MDKGTIKVPNGASTTRIGLKEVPDSLEEVRVTLVHSSGKRVDVANSDLTLEENVLELSSDAVEKYADLYRDEGEDDRFIIEVDSVDGDASGRDFRDLFADLRKQTVVVMPSTQRVSDNSQKGGDR